MTIDVAATSRQHELFPSGAVWHMSSDGDDSIRHIFDRHYSRRKNSRSNRFVGPGEKIILHTPNYDAIFIWRYERFRMDKQAGINCAVFRNEGNQKSSFLILEAEKFAWNKWPEKRLFTFVDSRKIKSSNPGYCFIKAGWGKCGITKGGLHILEKYPNTE